MRSRWRRLGAAAGVLVAACSAPAPGGGTHSGSRPLGSRDIITSQEIGRGQWSNAYDLVHNLRPGWLQKRGPDSFENPGEIQVYVDGTRLGDIHLLRTLPTSAIRRLEWIDPVSAAGRWGLNHSHGVIHVLYGRSEERELDPDTAALVTHDHSGGPDGALPDPTPVYRRP